MWQYVGALSAWSRLPWFSQDVVDEAAVTDGNIITSRMPEDVPAFTDALIGAIQSR